MGSIRSSVAATLTPARLALALADDAPMLLTESDFMGALAAEPKTTQVNSTKYRKWLDTAAGYTSARAPPVNAVAAKKK